MPVFPSSHFLLLYGSQTGQAKAICEEITERANEQNLQPELHCLSLTEKKFFLERETCAVIVISTTGDGEAPDTASKFVRRLKKKTLPNDYLSKLNYTLLGLGDSNYTNFCNCGKSLDKRLHELGAKRFYDCGWADDAVGLEEAVDPWIDGLWSALKKFLNLPLSSDSIIDTHISSDLSETNSITKTTNAIIDSENTNKDMSTSVKTVQSANSDTAKNGVSQTSVDSSKIAESLANSPVEKEDNSSKSAESLSTSSMETETIASVRLSVPPLSESALSLPVCPPSYLKVTYLPETAICVNDLPLQNGCDFPSASTPITMATVSKLTKLTTDNAVKKTMLVELDITDSSLQYQPGDSFSVICPNNLTEVAALLERLGVVEKKDTCIEISVVENTKKKNASVPKYIPDKLCTLNHIFTTCVDIREPPKKAFLRALVEYTSDDAEKRRIQELCSKQGNTDYAEFVRKPSLSILDVLNNFKSCNPPIERLLEHLPRLQPRPYSVCTSPLTSPGKLQFVFNVVEITMDCGRTYDRKGVCTGWIEQMMSPPVNECGDAETETVNKLEEMTLTDKLIPIFGRTSQSFHLPDDVTIPLILIGPGTGVAPFIGYLDHRSSQKISQPDAKFGDVWLFYGCRHQERDYLFRDKLDQHLSSGTLNKLLVSFSRDEQPDDCPRYVQDNIRRHGEDIVRLIEESNAMIYVCGDANNMAKDVNDAFIDVFSKYKDITSDDARKLVMKLRLDKRYKEDVWT